MCVLQARRILQSAGLGSETLCVFVSVYVCLCVCVEEGYIQWLDLCEERLFEIATYSGLFRFSPQ